MVRSESYGFPMAVEERRKTRYPDDDVEDFICPMEQSWRIRWKTATRKAEVKCWVHDLRHSVITRMAEKGAPIPTIQSISGHMSAKLTKHYTHGPGQAEGAGIPIHPDGAIMHKKHHTPGSGFRKGF